MGQVAQQLYFDNYSPVGDIVVLATCIMIIVLILTSYVNRSRSFRVFLCIISALFLAAMADIVYHILYNYVGPAQYAYVYLIRCVYHFILYINLVLYIVYIIEIMHLEYGKRVSILFVTGVLFVIVVFADVSSSLSGKGFEIEKTGVVKEGRSLFAWGYISFIVVIVFLMFAYRSRVFNQVMRGFYGVMGVSFMLLIIQGLFKQSSFTVASFMFPTIAMLYIIHANPYDTDLGAVDIRALEDIVRYNYEKKSEFLFMSLYLPDCDEEGKGFPEEMHGIIRKVSGEFFKGALLFQVSNGHVILVARKNKNPDLENRINKLLNEFDKEYAKYRLDYKIVMGDSIDEISRKNEYISFIRSIHRNMKMNEVHLVEYEDVTEFNKYQYILEELGDIYRRHDLRDPRVLAYCQPVFNIRKQKYDTAEALMRLRLDDVGMVFPDLFIPMAEENGYIHVLTEIILQKTCDEIKYLLKEGFEVKRISINVSALELREDGFCDDINRIIKGSGIPDEKIAIEITESQSESDFIVIKEKIEELKDKGIKFYLDDFGTGYSNMERIMELPFDIIKFDRSLVLASDSDDRSKKMVESLAGMFRELKYSVLYEGVENEMDEERCIEMHASYLQGYKYSRPIPMIELKNFFSRVENEG